MSIDLKQLFEVVGDVQEIDYPFDLSEYELFGLRPFVTPVAVKGRISNKAGIVSCVFTVDFKLKVCCDRCLDEFDREFHDSFEHILVTNLNTDNDEYIIVEDFQLDLDALVLDDILLTLPSKLLCSEDCKGLCTKCGQNLNKDSCECKDDFVDPRFAVLGELLK